ncbi:MAG TPA: site-2 protease family protein [Rhabdochlamydiaceae bacterium]|jgi:regulator of sigma E protease
MIHSIFHILLAALGLGLLIFIHELGHYWMARRVGMTVEVFSIGFGKPFYSWQHKGVKWQFCWLPFGGYVRIAGMEKKGFLEPYDIPDGFYGKSPWARIKVAAIGPIVNLVFAFLAFTLLWVCGGRQKPFSEYTRLIGWVDPCSDLYQSGVRSGDEIMQLNHKPFTSFHDVLYASMLDDATPVISGYKIDYFTQEKMPFTFAFPMNSSLKGVERLHAVFETLAPAGYLIYLGENGALPEGSPMRESGIKNKDRILWADGKLIFSRNELIETINEPKALLTVKRGDQAFLTRVPRVKVSDLRINSVQRAEWEDWQHEQSIKGRVQDLFCIPYTFTPEGTIESQLSYLNAESREESPCARERSANEIPLNPSDRIIAVDGIPIHSAIELIQYLQTRHIQLIVDNETDIKPLLWKVADKHFACDIDWNALGQMSCTIGSENPIRQLGNVRLLNPVEPKHIGDLPLSEGMRSRIAENLSAQKKAIEEMGDSQEKETALELFEENQRKLMLGIPLQDKFVHYNPSPFTLFANVLSETWRTLFALFTGILSPKWLAGPVGMVQVMQQSWTVGVKEALYWLAVISMNLGILNFLPVPVLDGGHICFSLWEAITKKRIKSKTMERLILPFILLLIALFIYLTYHDIARLITRFL